MPPHQVEEARESISARSSASAPSSRLMLNLKCTGVEGGLLGRSLITLAPNKCSDAARIPPIHVCLPWYRIAIGSAWQSQTGADGALRCGRILPGCSATPLPPHKFSPHDIVAIRSNKGDPAAEPIVEGVVYRIKVPHGAQSHGPGAPMCACVRVCARVGGCDAASRAQDTEIVVAVEELPDDGLDVPLRCAGGGGCMALCQTRCQAMRTLCARRTPNGRGATRRVSVPYRSCSRTWVYRHMHGRRLERLANDITFKRYSSTLQSLSGGQAALGPASRIVDVLFGRAEPRFHDKCPPWTPMNKGTAGAAHAATFLQCVRPRSNTS